PEFSQYCRIDVKRAAAMMPRNCKHHGTPDPITALDTKASEVTGRASPGIGFRSSAASWGGSITA
ncbi:hypothetical protein ACDY97_32250, partial [Rhizobium mongolense]